MYAGFLPVDQSPDPSGCPAMSYFFYGTLCDPDVLRLVLGYRPSRRQLAPAVLTGFRRKIARVAAIPRSEEHTSELQSLMRISYAVFCLKKKIIKNEEGIT